MSRGEFTFWMQIDVRWGDMDSQGHVNNAVYFTYCESVRVALLDQLGIRGKRGGRFGPALVSATCNFRRQVLYPAQLDVGVVVDGVGTRSFRMKYGLFLNGTDDLVADGTSVNAWIDYEESKSVPLDDEMKAALSQFMIAPPAKA